MTAFFLAWYILFGVCWAGLIATIHPVIRQLRKTLGDRYVFLVILPVVFLWPVEVFGVFVHFFLLLCCYVIRRIQGLFCVEHTIYDKREIQRKILRKRQDGLYEVAGGGTKYVFCSQCGVRHRWLGSRAEMEKINWVVLKDSPTGDERWFCPECDPWVPAEKW